MSTKEKVINILNFLTEEDIKNMYSYGQFLAYQRDDYLTVEEIESLNEAIEEYKNGETMSHTELLKELNRCSQ